jgi:hypothetical protein
MAHEDIDSLMQDFHQDVYSAVGALFRRLSAFKVAKDGDCSPYVFNEAAKLCAGLSAHLREMQRGWCGDGEIPF